MMEMGLIKVGQPYSIGVDFEGVDRFELRYRDGHVMLQVLIPSPNERDVQAFLGGAIHLGLYGKGASVFYLFKIDGLYDWSDQAFSINLLPTEDRVVPDFAAGLRQLQTFVLIDSVTGIVKGVRAATWSPHLTDLFFRFLRRQISERLTTEQHQENIASAYAEHSSSKSLAKAAIVRERAGSTSL